MAQAQETKKNGGNARWRNKLHFDIMLNSVFLFIIGLSKPSSTTSTSLSASNLVSNSNLSSSFNSGLNTFGLNNSYTGNNMNGGSNGVGAFGNGGGGGGGTGGGRGGGGGLGGGGGGGGGISGAGSWGGPSCKLNWRQVWLSSEKKKFCCFLATKDRHSPLYSNGPEQWRRRWRRRPFLLRQRLEQLPQAVSLGGTPCGGPQRRRRRRRRRAKGPREREEKRRGRRLRRRRGRRGADTKHNGHLLIYFFSRGDMPTPPGFWCQCTCDFRPAPLKKISQDNK